MTTVVVRGSGRPVHPFRRWLTKRRAWIEQHPFVRRAYRALVAMVGVVVVLVGIVMIPLPGPGWLVVFLGVALLGTEFQAARRFNLFLRRMLARATAWWARRRTARAQRA